MARVLVVDDDESIAKLLTAVLQEDGFEVDVATDVKRGIELARTCRPDVALVDLMMRGDGETVCGVLQALGGGVPTILVSAVHDLRPIGKGWEVQHLAKPFEIDDVVASVRRAL